MATRSQLDRLGDRLKGGDFGESDLRTFDEYRRSFAGPYEHVIETTRRVSGLQPTGRPAKSTTSVIEKLNRESIRLTQIQDIAGCRLIVADLDQQDATVSRLQEALTDVATIDRRGKPSHGYRAVHLVARHEGLSVEIQVRTRLQHTWAEISEKLADTIDPAIKYGGGPGKLPELLETSSSTFARGEENLRQIKRLEALLEEKFGKQVLPEAVKLRERLDAVRATVNASADAVVAAFLELIVGKK